MPPTPSPAIRILLSAPPQAATRLPSATLTSEVEKRPGTIEKSVGVNCPAVICPPTCTKADLIDAPSRKMTATESSDASTARSVTDDESDIRTPPAAQPSRFHRYAFIRATTADPPIITDRSSLPCPSTTCADLNAAATI